MWFTLLLTRCAAEVVVAHPSMVLPLVEHLRKTNHAAALSVGCVALLTLSLSLQELKSYKVIVRNLPYDAVEKQLHGLGARFGYVLDHSLQSGYGFLQYMSEIDAARAVRCISGRELGGRLLAADWALSRDQYVAHL